MNTLARGRWYGVLISSKGLGAAALALAALFGIKHWAFPAPVRSEFLTAPVLRGDVEETVLASGTIEPLKLVNVGAQASGRIVALHVALGDKVTKGVLVAEIDPATERNALATAEAVLAQNRAQRASRAVALHQADLAFRRAMSTSAEEASSQADLEAAEAAYRGANEDVVALDAALRQARIAVDTARVNLGYTKVIAPVAGTVVAIVVPEGQNVNAVQSAPTVVKVADLETMTVKAKISEADVLRVRPGQTVYFTILGAPEHRYYAKLRAVEPAPESIANDTATGIAASSSTSSSSAVYYNGLFEVGNSEHTLRPSMTAEVHIVLQQVRGALSIPADALDETLADGRRVVRVLGADQRVESRYVQIGVTTSSMAEVLAGLKEGERVVVSDSSNSSATEGVSGRGAGKP